MTSLRIRVQSLFVINGDFFSGINVAQREEQDVAAQVLHIGVRLAAVIDVMRAIAAAGTVEAPTTIDVTDA